jgi:hypothetical protein
MSTPSLHDRLMNLECVIPDHLEEDAAVRMAYRVGHRDALHAAAELALEADAVRNELVIVVRKLIAARDKQTECLAFCIDCDSFIEEAEAALASATRGEK